MFRNLSPYIFTLSASVDNIYIQIHFSVSNVSFFP
jgi:hypothetical protein